MFQQAITNYLETKGEIKNLEKEIGIIKICNFR